MEDKKEMVPSSNWDYRVMVEERPPEVVALFEDNSPLVFSIEAIFYTNDIPTSHERTALYAGVSQELINTLYKMLEAFEKPALWKDRRFPTEFVP